MRLRKLTLENFGPYAHQHEINLEVPAWAPIIVIHGENGRGKTSIYNAILWALYGSVADRRGRQRASATLMSYEALSSGEYFMTVTLDFEHEGAEYSLARHVQADRRPVTDAALTFKVSLRRDGHFLPTEEIKDRIASILDPRIARFFLFDAEMLEQYEELIDEPGRNTELIRDSIERILGLPALQLSQQDIRNLRASAEGKQLAMVKATQQHEVLVAEVQQAQEAVNSIDRDLTRLDGMLQTAEAQKAAATVELQQFIEVQADVRELDRLEAEERQSKESEQRSLQHLRDVVGAGWWAPVIGPVRERLAIARESIRVATEHIRDDASKRHLVDLIIRAIDEDRCEICHQELDTASRSVLVSRVEELKAVLNDAHDEQARLQGAVAEQSMLQPFDDADLIRRISERELEVRRFQLRLRTLANSLTELRNRLRQYPKAEISGLERKLAAANDEIRQISESIATRKLDRDKQASVLQALQRDLQRLPNADRRTSIAFGIYSGLDAIFERALADFRTTMRTEVQNQASAIFQRLSSEPDYGGLRINDQFGLQVVTVNDALIPDISAGYAQIVALSLVGALNRCATRVGPVVIDTPLARLDLRHREKVLRFIPSMASQVILLVQSSEFDRTRDMPHLEGKVGRELTIERVSYQSSRVVPTEAHR